jgi:hypothetical protein
VFILNRFVTSRVTESLIKSLKLQLSLRQEQIKSLKFEIRIKSQEFKFEVSSSKFQVRLRVDQLTQSGKFENLLELNSTLLSKENLILIYFSISVQIYKNYGGQKVFVSRVQTELINSVYRLIFLGFSLTFIPL